MSSREAARATSSMLSSSAAAGIFSPPLLLRLRELREVLDRQHPQVEAGAAAADLDVPLGLPRLDLHASGRPASGRPRRRGGRGGGPRRRSSTSASSVVSSPRSRSVAARVTPPVAGIEEDAGERLGGGAGGNSPGDDRELGDEIFAFGRELQVMSSDLAFLSWVRSCGKSLVCGGFGVALRICGVWKALWEVGDSYSASGAQRSSPTGLWIAPRNSRTFSASSASSSRLASTRRSELRTVVWSRPP